MLTPTTMTKEYEHLQRVFHWGTEELLRSNLMGLDAAFLDDGVKYRLRKRLLEVYGEASLPA